MEWSLSFAGSSSRIQVYVVLMSCTIYPSREAKCTLGASNSDTPKIQFQGVRNLFFVADLCSL